jgi:benzoyl-CoA reductase/2-hydroxyglutaryl-CoA dehydratase subunit BcrC/BadD/HgdB
MGKRLGHRQWKTETAAVYAMGQDCRKDEGMRNTLRDLNNHLFAQLERLTEEGISDEQLEKEMNRSREVTRLASQIISNGQLVLKAKQFVDDQMGQEELPKMLEG